jgi:hypothetical protein
VAEQEGVAFTATIKRAYPPGIRVVSSGHLTRLRDVSESAALFLSFPINILRVLLWYHIFFLLPTFPAISPAEQDGHDTNTTTGVFEYCECPIPNAYNGIKLIEGGSWR